ncbi:WGR domain-containing protein [Sinorhizobium meliloti]|uniref:WGR domain-containing protein n=1 Tax=Rhizobium meliloti TaxID=382 RepID=UPI0039893D2E
MPRKRFRLYVQRIDTTKNTARFYAMSIEPDLFGDSAWFVAGAASALAAKTASARLPAPAALLI